MSISRATPHLFTMRQRVYAVSALTCHPDTDRIVVLIEGPCAMNNGIPRSVLGKYKDGKYYAGMGYRMEIEIEPEHTVWMECPFSEGPFYVGNVTTNTIMTDVKTYPVFNELDEASKFVNDMNMVSMGNPTYSVVDKNGILIDHKGYYTQHAIAQGNKHRYAEKIDDKNKSINLDFGNLK